MESKIWIEGADATVADAIGQAPLVDSPKDADIKIYQPAQKGFWHVDQHFDEHSEIFGSEFKPEQIHDNKAVRYFEAMRERILQPFPHSYPLEDFVLVALTDSLEAPDSETPNSIEMIDRSLEMEPERLILIRMPDDTIYSGPLKDQLFEFDFHERIIFTRGNIDRLLDACAFVVTQDSPLAVRGLLHKKPAIQFAKTDCHHIFRKAYVEKRLKKCFNRMMRDRPEYEKYVYWLFKERMLDASAPNFEKLLRERIERLN